MSSLKAVPVVLVEDRKSHSKAIIARLQREGFLVELFDAQDDPQLYRMRARHPDFQICIVDYELRPGYANGVTNGLELMNRLWEADRHLLFVLFTGIRNSTIYRQSGANSPIYETVSKRIGLMSDPIPGDALDALVASVRNLQKLTTRSLPVPERESLRLEERLAGLEPDPIKREGHFSVALGCANRSEDLVATLRREAISLSRIGGQMHDVSVTVFGSLGRWELREKSDVEICALAFPQHGDRAELSRVAAHAWNSLYWIVKELRFKVEGEKLPEFASLGYLEAGAMSDGCANKYSPIINVAELLAQPLDKNSLACTRMHQIFFEHRAIANSDALDRIKVACIQALSGSRSPSLEGLLRAPLFRSTLSEFEKRAPALGDVRSVAGLKKACLRLFNSLSSRLFLAWRLDRKPNSHLVARDRPSNLFEEISFPGIAKVAIVWEELEALAQPGLPALGKELKSLALRYGDAFVRLQEAEESKDVEASSAVVSDMLKHFSGVFSLMRKKFEFSGRSGLEWLVADAPDITEILVFPGKKGKAASGAAPKRAKARARSRPIRR